MINHFLIGTDNKCEKKDDMSPMKMCAKQQSNIDVQDLHDDNLDKTIPLSMDDVGKNTPCEENSKKRVLKKEKYEKKCRENSYIESNDRNLKGRKNKLARQHRFESNDSEQQNAVDTFNLAALQEEMK